MNEVSQDVSRETSMKLGQVAEMVRKWSARINLVSPGSLADLERRHIDDSLLLHSCAPDYRSWVDLGSGGGFPGIVIGVMSEPDRSVVLIESDRRKCAFLNSVRRELDLGIIVRNDRIEASPPEVFDVISARALASLPKLLELSNRFMGPETVCLFAKGVTWREEVEAAKKGWTFDLEVVESPIEEGSVVLKISQVERI